MALKDVMKSLIGKKESRRETGITAGIEAGMEAEVQGGTPGEQGMFLTSDSFPIFPASAVDLSRYRSFPLTDLAALGIAFSTLPDAARTITQTATTHIATDMPIFAGLWPEGVAGRMLDRGPGFSGNIADLDGSSGIVGRMRYKLLDGGVPVTTTTNTVLPFDPMTMMMAAALIGIDSRLNDLQEKAEEILQFLKLEKQSKQRGNLNMLSEIMEEYKRDCNNEKVCALRVVAVQDIKREAHQDILFYQEQIARKLRAQRAIHVAQDAQALLDTVISEFYEYQLASYLYAYTSFLEIMLQKNFDAAPVAAERMEAFAGKYSELYADCHAQIANYQRTSIEAQVISGLGNAAKAVGQRIASVSVLSKSSVDATLINAGKSLDRFNSDAVAKRLERLAPLADSRMDAFIRNTRTMELLFSKPEAMITDGKNLYIMEAA